jgi:hydrogenase-4 component B
VNPGALLGTAAASLAASIVIGPRSARVWLALTVTGVLTAVGAAFVVLLGAADWQWRSAFLLGGERVYIRLDGLSALFIVLVGVVGGAGAVYAHEYWSEAHYPASSPRGRAWWSGLVLSMGLVLTIANGLHFLIAWESFAICAYFLITLDRRRRAVRSAGWLYLVASHAGTVALFAFFASLAARTGSWELGPVRDQASLAPLFWLALFGFGVKSGFFPLHFWLPDAHANAPSHVSAVMSAVAIKMGVYGIVRFSGWLPMPAAAGWVVITLGATSALLGIAFAFAQDDVKRLLAYCSVENVGVILIGLGGAMLATAHGHASWGLLALAGALFHVWNHGAFKALLFFGAGSVLHGTGTRTMSRLGGLWHRMPWTAALFAIGAVAVSGLPPLNGFVSEWLVYLGLLDAVTIKGPAAWAAVPAIIMLAMAGALALATFTKAGGLIFLGSPRTPSAAAAHESGLWMRAPMVTLAAMCIALALAPVLVWRVLARAVGAWDATWPSAPPPPMLATLGLTQLALAFFAIAATMLLWRTVRANGMRRALTWDCGYAAPTVRMQYSSGSFAGIASGWFAWVLRPQTVAKRPRGLLPRTALRLRRTPETVLQFVIGPVSGAINRSSRAARRLQHGNLQAYILYVIAALVALGAMAWLEGAS